jgi:hypothetical protein
MSRFVFVLTILTVAALTAACQRGAASRTRERQMGQHGVFLTG